MKEDREIHMDQEAIKTAVRKTLMQLSDEIPAETIIKKLIFCEDTFSEGPDDCRWDEIIKNLLLNFEIVIKYPPKPKEKKVRG